MSVRSHTSLHDALAFVVERRGGLVEHQDARPIFELHGIINADRYFVCKCKHTKSNLYANVCTAYTQMDVVAVGCMEGRSAHTNACTLTGLRTSARAMAMRCFCPPLSLLPRAPTLVSYPAGNWVTNSCAFAAFAAASTSSRDARLLPMYEES